MSRKVVLADAGPLIGLARIDALVLLSRLFGRVVITDKIHAELFPSAGSFADAALLQAALDQDWIKVVNAPPAPFKLKNPGVDAGEASAIHLACHCRDAGDAVLLVMDDRVGRLEACSHGIALIGTAGLIAMAKTQGLIPAARPLLENLARNGYYLGNSVTEAVLARIGE